MCLRISLNTCKALVPGYIEGLQVNLEPGESRFMFDGPAGAIAARNDLWSFFAISMICAIGAVLAKSAIACSLLALGSAGFIAISMVGIYRLNDRIYNLDQILSKGL